MNVFRRNHAAFERYDTPPGLPNWPCFALAHNQFYCIVSGRHLTPGSARMAKRCGLLIAVAGVTVVTWNYWGMHNLPVWLHAALTFIGAQLGCRFLTFDKRRWIVAGSWFFICLFVPLWGHLIAYALYPMFRRSTTVRFTADRVFVHRLLGRVERDRRAIQPVTFLLQQHPKLPWLELKARRQGKPELAVFHQQTRYLYLQYGHELIEVGRFAFPYDAERFLHACLFALTQPLKQPIVPANFPHFPLSGDVLNVPDI